MASYVGTFLALLFLTLCHLGQLDKTCPSDAAKLVATGCSRGCISVSRDNYPCPSCRSGCEDTPDECSPTDSGTCTENTICLAVGVGGRYSCVNLTETGGSCSNDYDSISMLADEDARKLISKPKRRGVIVPCKSGLVCRRIALETKVCRAVNVGPCTVANSATEAAADCDEDGNYAPRQCRLVSSTRKYNCRCVHLNGTDVSGTGVEVDSLREAPDCKDIVLSKCKYRTADGISYSVKSGDTFIDISTCSRCLCKNGEATLCVRQSEGSCNKINPESESQAGCVVGETMIESGTSAPLDCNICKCNNGKLFCTRRLCKDDDDADGDGDGDGDGDDNGDSDGDDDTDVSKEKKCQRCGNLEKDQVCGNDGKTYLSRCFAVNCRGLDSDTLTIGSCATRDVCGENPCDDGSVCLKMGGVTCLSREGCRAERLRECVDLETLTCTVRDDNATVTAEEDAVCGDDMKTYKSVCNLLQNSPNLQVMYAGKCNRTECSGDEVCGTDGETYANRCELKSKSANARVDYRGACGDDKSGEVVKDKCARLRTSGKCEDLTDCTSVVQPGDGCCYICGGAVTIGLDLDAVDEYTRLNPDLETVDEFLTMLISSDFIPEDITRSCKIQANLLSTGSLHMVFENVNNSQSIKCKNYSDSIADQINNRTADSTETTIYPQILQFATVAQPSPFVIAYTSTLTDGGVSTTLTAITFNLIMVLLTALAILVNFNTN